MYIHVDLGEVPPAIELREPDDFTGFRVVVAAPGHTWVDPAILTGLANGLAVSTDPAWGERLAGMLRYAGGKGWIDDRGRVRAHVELEAADG